MAKQTKVAANLAQNYTPSEQAQARQNIGLATVAHTGDFNDLVNKPTNLTGQIQSNWTQDNVTAVDYIRNKPVIHTYTAGDNVSITNDDVISAVDTKYTAGTGLTLDGTEFSADTTVLQEKLTAGTNVQINDNVISATDTKYTAGTNVQINSSNVISATDTTYSAGSGITLTGTTFSADKTVMQEKLTAGTNVQINDNVISATDTKYTAGTNVSINSSNVISATDTTYTAGTNVQISNANVISATDTTYSAGANISIDANNVISATDTTYTAGDGIRINQYDNNKITWVKPTGFAEATNLWFENAGDFPFMGWTITDNGQAGVKSHGYPQIYISEKNNLTEAPSPGPGGGVGYVILNPGVWQINYAIPFYTDVAGTDGGIVNINCYATAKDMVTEVGAHVAYNHINVNRNIADVTYWVELNFSVRAVNQTQIYFDAEIIQNGSSDGLAIKLRRGPFNAVQIR